MEAAALIVNPFFPPLTLIVTDWMLVLLIETASLVIKDYFIKCFMLKPFFILWQSDGFTDLLMPKSICFWMSPAVTFKVGTSTARGFLREFNGSLKWFQAFLQNEESSHLNIYISLINRNDLNLTVRMVWWTHASFKTFSVNFHLI